MRPRRSLLKFCGAENDKSENNFETFSSQRPSPMSATPHTSHSASTFPSILAFCRQLQMEKANLNPNEIRNGRALFDIGRENMQYLSIASDAASCIRSSNSIFPFSPSNSSFYFLFFTYLFVVAQNILHSISMQLKINTRDSEKKWMQDVHPRSGSVVCFICIDRQKWK